jgi:hypothetical protein
MVELADQVDGSVESEDVMVAMTADVHRAPADRAGSLQDIEFPEGEIGIVGPAVGYDDFCSSSWKLLIGGGSEGP